MTVYLDYYKQTFEAAKGFDDDLDFCPSLSPSELREIQKTRRTSTPIWRQHHHNQHGDKRRIPSSSLSYASYPWSPSSSSSASSSGASSPSLSSSSPSASPPLSPVTNPTTSRAIAIVDPISRAPVLLPGATGLTSSSGTVTASSGNTPGASTAVGGGSDGGSGYFSSGSLLSLSPPLMFHESALATPLESADSMLFSPSSPTSSSTSEDMFEGTYHQQFWMDYPSAQAQYFPYPLPLHPHDFSSFPAPAPGSYPIHHYPAMGAEGGGGPGGYVAVPMMMMGF